MVFAMIATPAMVTGLSPLIATDAAAFSHKPTHRRQYNEEHHHRQHRGGMRYRHTLHAQRNCFWRGVLIVNTTQKEINEAVTALVREYFEAGINVEDITNGLKDSIADAGYISAQREKWKTA
tara:strand:+ start:7198 stop:7563 length:366 start_codon:yes stop_codon:yes gene_type:complete